LPKYSSPLSLSHVGCVSWAGPSSLSTLYGRGGSLPDLVGRWENCLGVNGRVCLVDYRTSGFASLSLNIKSVLIVEGKELYISVSAYAFSSAFLLSII